MQTGTLRLLAFSGALGLIAVASYEHSETSYTCLQCRAERTVETRWGFKSEKITDNSVTPELLANYPIHQHQWCWCGSTHTQTILGKIYACGKRHPIWDIPPSFHAQFARKATLEELQTTLDAIDSKDRNRVESSIKTVWERAQHESK
uniref:Uncharacterized protein n=1 Tax=uncultured Verrucomicrobiota bacterium TaxID=156588 RepID=D2DXW8_9BACT|nr:hypothetical protein [uncultured Verrucomicrobiota bacterium]